MRPPKKTWAYESVRPHTIRHGQFDFNIRKSDSLFILLSSSKKGKAASSRIIATWITKMINLAFKQQGLAPKQNVQAHSTREVAALRVAFTKVSLEDIYKMARALEKSLSRITSWT